MDRSAAGAASRSGLEALTLDVWYTLVYLRPVARRRLERERWRTWTDPLVRTGFTRAVADGAVKDLHAWANREEVQGRTPRLAEQARWLRRRVGKPVALDRVASASDDALRRAPVLLAEGVKPALRAMARAGIRLGIVSNVRYETGDGARAMLERTGLLSRMDAVTLSCEYPWAKPRPEPFLRCLEELRVPAGAAAHVGDHPFDVLGARRAGLEPILYTGLHRWEQPRPSFERGAGPGSSFSRWDRAVDLVHLEPRRGHATRGAPARHSREPPVRGRKLSREARR